MAFCAKCGTQIGPDAKFCPACGTPVNPQPGTQGQASPHQDHANTRAQVDAVLEKFKNTTDHTEQFSREDIEQNKAMAILAYLGILVLVPIFAAKDSRFARFHANQGLMLLITMVSYWIIEQILNAVFFAIWWGLGSIFSILLNLVYVLFVVYIVLGIVNAAKGEAKELPVIGRITILH